MRREVHIRFETKTLPQAHAILEPAACGPDVANVEEVPVLREVQVFVTLPDGDARVPRLVEQLERCGKLYILSHWDRYTDEERDNARLLFLDLTYDCEVDGGSEFGTTYDLSGACPNCGAGARQTSAMFLDGDDDQLPKLQGHRAGRTYRDEVFLDDRLAAEIDALAPKGLLFHQVYALMPNKRQVKIPWKQLSADRVLPPMSPLTIGFHRPHPCPVCPRSGYWDGVPTPRIVYRERDLEGAGDVNLTWEEKYAGEITANPREWRVPVPWLLVTPKVMRIFRAAGVTEFEWIPIRVVDE